MEKVILLPTAQDAAKRPDGLSRRQGHLILLLLAANVVVQMWGWRASDAASLGMYVLVFAKWMGLIAGATTLVGLVLIAGYIVWNGYWLGKRFRRHN